MITGHLPMFRAGHHVSKTRGILVCFHMTGRGYGHLKLLMKITRKSKYSSTTVIE
jgi:hypothetical protein